MFIEIQSSDLDVSWRLFVPCQLNITSNALVDTHYKYIHNYGLIDVHMKNPTGNMMSISREVLVKNFDKSKLIQVDCFHH